MFSAVFGILLSISRETYLKMRKREEEAVPIIQREPADEVQASLDDLENMESANLDNEQDYGV